MIAMLSANWCIGVVLPSEGIAPNGLVEIVKFGLYLADRLKIFKIFAVPALKTVFHVDDKNVVGWIVSRQV